jgi:predicted transcriptional regulator
MAFRAPSGLVAALDELASHRHQNRGALLRDLVERALADGDVAGADLTDPAPGEGMRLLAARARGGDAACIRALATLQERARLQERQTVDPIAAIWGDES